MANAPQVQQIRFTEGQEIAYGKLKAFLRGPERMFLLTGKAGTGKTTLMRYALDELLSEDYRKITRTKRDEIAYPTVLGVTLAHKAKNNLQQRGGIPYVNTFASCYGHKEVYTDDGKREFVPDYKKMVHADCKKPIRVFVFDEVSMFSQRMLDLVMKETSLFAKIIFMGDRGQLPPIIDKNERDVGQDSPIFELNFPDSCNHNLTERVRQTKDNPIIDLSDIVYNQIFEDPDNITPVFKALSQDVVENGVGHKRIKYDELLPLFQRSSNDYLDTKLVAYRNRTVDAYNLMLRNYIHNHPEPVFIKGEIVYMNQTFYGKDHKGDNFAFYNASEYIIQGTFEGEIDGIKVMYAILKDDCFMPVVVGGKDTPNYRLFLSRKADFVNEKDWEGMYNFLDKFGNFSYGYCLTSYKAQGSTYKTVFVDVNDMFTIPILSNKRKLQSLYTALTRASHMVYFLGK